jgi:spermidine/putrescine-binding protein
MQKLQAISIIVILTLILAVSLPVYASCVRSIPYTTFNNSTFKPYPLDKNYTKGFYAEIVNNLVYNTTTNKAAIVRLHFGESSGSGAYLELSYWGNKELHIWYNDGTSSIEIGVSYWESGNTTKVYVSEDGVLSVKDYKGNYAVKNYGIGAVTLYYVGGHGETTAKIANSGYVTVEVSDYASSGDASGATETVLTWLPLIITFAMLGVVLGMIKKFT